MKMEPIIYHWHFDLLILLFIAALIGLYALISRFRYRLNNFCFWIAILIFFITECSPLDYLGMHYYFSVHMIGHVVILLICGPLLVMSIPHRPSLFVLNTLTQVSGYLASHAWLAWFAGVGIMWFWHIPPVFDFSFAAMNSSFGFFPLLHAGSMLIGGILFSWPLFGPFRDKRIHPLAGVVYLFTACISCSLLGLLITFAPAGTYHHYVDMTIMGNPWNISRQQDQEAAGLIMWVPCCFVYLGGCIFLLLRWFSERMDTPEKDWIKIDPLITTNHGKQ
jgi:cytochrome c oxidase assembly factor CtaG